MLHRNLSIRLWFGSSLGVSILMLISMIGAGSAEAQSWMKLGTFKGYICLAKFLDANTGFVGFGVSPGKGVTCSIELEKTTDGGKTWVKATIPSGYGGEIGDILMVDSLNGWLAMTAWNGGNSALWHTTDAGMTWNETPLGGSGTSVKITPSAMIVTDLLGSGHISTDGGKTFSNGFLNSTNCVDFVDPLHGVISCYRGENWINSSDGGLTWRNSNMTVEAWSVYGDSGTPDFYAAPEGPTNGQAWHGIIYHSTDYGATWGTLAQFPFVFTGHLTGLGQQYLFMQVTNVNNTIGNVTYEGFYYSTDQGVTWTGIGGPCALNDTRFTVLNECSGITLYGFDTAANGSLFEYNFGTGINDVAELSLPNVSQITQSSCAPTQAIIPVKITGCVPGPAKLDSLWLVGSPAFSIVDSRKAPRTLADTDSVTVEYSPSAGGSDTARLNIRYNLGSGVRDTSVTIVGSLTNTLLSAPVRLHREVGVSYFGSLDSLPLGIDMNSSINVDSIWPYLHSISGTISFDSSVVNFAAYFPPSGWTLSLLLNRGDAVDFGIHNLSSTIPSQPVDLGTVLFLPSHERLATSDVSLANLVMNIGTQAIAPCVVQDEDQHWSVKVLVADGVNEAESASQQNSLSIYPNPAGDELFVQNSNSLPVSITLYDVIGRAVLSANAVGSSTTTFEMQVLPSGSYMLVGHIGDSVITKLLSKIR
jgi:photosystem II stability/assembly factor-like uncharacterized protein